MLKQDPTVLTPEIRQRARAVQRKVMGPQLRMIARYFRPGFHPWDFDDTAYLTEWYASPEGA